MQAIPFPAWRYSVYIAIARSRVEARYVFSLIVTSFETAIIKTTMRNRAQPPDIFSGVFN
jgi:hypothetical protein